MLYFLKTLPKDTKIKAQVSQYLISLGLFVLISSGAYGLNPMTAQANTPVEEKKQNLTCPETLKKEALQSTGNASNSTTQETALYVFVSLSMPKPALLALNQEAVKMNATLVLKGLKENSYQKTALYLQEIIAKTGQGFLIHPELFKRYGIEQVPTIVLTTDPLSDKAVFDVVSGHIPIKTALLKIAEQGELAIAAKDWLQRRLHED